MMKSLKVFISLTVILAMSDLCVCDPEGLIAKAAAINMFTSFDEILAENNIPAVDSGCIHEIPDPTLEQVKDCANNVATNYGNTFKEHNIFEIEAVHEKMEDVLDTYELATKLLSDELVPMKDFVDEIIATYYS